MANYKKIHYKFTFPKKKKNKIKLTTIITSTINKITHYRLQNIFHPNINKDLI